MLLRMADEYVTDLPITCEFGKKKQKKQVADGGRGTAWV
jgi:hypothetical protein